MKRQLGYSVALLLWIRASSILAADSPFWNSVSSSANSTPSVEETVGFIIQLDTGVSLKGPDFHTRAKNTIGDYEVKREFADKGALFYGLAITFSDDKDASARKADIDALASFPDVIGVWPNKVRPRPQPAVKSPRGPEAGDASATGRRRSTLEQRDDAVSLPARIPSDGSINAQLAMTGVDRLHAKGIMGKGVKIGILDTGVDYRHPALGGGFGPGFKIAGGYDLVGDDFFNQSPDEDPLATCPDGGHGTHVSGRFLILEKKHVRWIGG